MVSLSLPASPLPHSVPKTWGGAGSRLPSENLSIGLRSPEATPLPVPCSAPFPEGAAALPVIPAANLAFSHTFCRK